MLRRMRVLGLTVTAGLWVSSACTFKGPPEPAGSGGTETGVEGGAPSSDGGSHDSSGKTSSGGKSGGGGKGGSGGTGGKASSGGKGGSGDTGGEAGRPGDGGAGGEGPACPGCESGFCLSDGTCVDCLPENDHCPHGQYCTPNNQCAPGCKADGSSCASGECGADHNCNNCISDGECLPDLVCGGGLCAAACTAAQEGTSTGCESGLTCCSLHCTELAVDSQNCGECGHACGGGQFCGVSECAGGEGGSASAESCVACHDVTLASVCSVSKVIVILDTSKNSADGNRVTGRAIGEALEQHCGSRPTVTEAEQDSVEALNFTTGQPVSDGGELLVVAGGPFFQVVEGYLESEKIAPLYWKVLEDATEYRKTSDDQPVLSLPIAGEHESHDSFIIQFMRDAKSGSLILNAQGLWLSGTIAAAYQMEHAILPSLATFDQAWYAYEWTDQDGDKAPDAGEIELVGSGS